MSLLSSPAEPIACSGETYIGVPICQPLVMLLELLKSFAMSNVGDGNFFLRQVLAASLLDAIALPQKYPTLDISL